ncbi:FHA domain-containing protein [Corallococcus interemptor]|uniref:FHA domain-containing protein n=1 Tax=Corallococcus interemptor TaxID=2316720 RepID=UPI003CFDBF92
MTQGLQVGRELAFEQAEVTIGRTSENDLVLHDHGVSRRHARITAKGGRYFAEDVGSANGTQLNGQPLAGEKQLRDGDRITVGPVEFTFVWVAPEDDDDVTRPIRRVLAPPNARVSPQGLEQASLAEIEAAPTSYQQSMPAMARPAAPPQRSSVPDLPPVQTPARAPAGPPVLAPPNGAAPARPGPPVLEASAPGRASAAGLPAMGASASNKAATTPPVPGATAQGRSSAPGLPAVAAPPANKPGQGAAPNLVSGPPVLDATAKAPGASAVRPSGPGLPTLGGPAPAPAPITALEMPVVEAPAAQAPAAPEKRKGVASLPEAGAPALNRPSLGHAAARAAAPVPGLPVMTPPGLMAPPPPARPSAPPAVVDLTPVLPDEPEERTLMAIPSVDSLGPPSAPALLLPIPDLDEPEERTLMAIPATPEAPPVPEAPPALLPPSMEEPEERTVLDLRPITPVSPLVAPPVRIAIAVPPAPAQDSQEPSTFVGQDDLSSAPEETRASGTFAGPAAIPPALVPAPAWSPPVPPPSPEPATFVGDRERAQDASTLDAGLLLEEMALLAPASPPAADGDVLSSPPPAPNGPVTVVAKVEPSAASKARQRRQLAKTLQGKFILLWQRQSLPRRIGFASLAVVGALVLVTLLVALVAPSAIRLPGREPSTLGMDPVADSFGLGEGVRWTHADDKLFDFRFVSPTRAVAVLHYQASNIARDEVNLSLNGVSLGWVPPDTAQTAERELEQVLPPSLLRRNANNQLLFDNALNPPGRDPWRIWNLRLEIIPVPELPPDQLVSSARESVRAGARFYELKDVGAENLFKAWREYRAAWITLEALDEKPELYDDVRERIAQISTELDHRCGQLMMQFQRAVQFRSRRDAVATLEDVRRRFPTAEHRCHNLALEKAYEHEL